MGGASSIPGTLPKAPMQPPVWHPLSLEEHPIDQAPSLKVIVVGAGIAGINAAILLPAKVPGLELTIYEREADIVRLPGTAPVYAMANDKTRAECGTSVHIRGFAVTSHHTCFNPHTHHRRTGLSTMRKERKSKPTGSKWLRNMKLRDTYAATILSRTSSGMKPSQNGSSQWHLRNDRQSMRLTLSSWPLASSAIPRSPTCPGCPTSKARSSTAQDGTTSLNLQERTLPSLEMAPRGCNCCRSCKR